MYYFIFGADVVVVAVVAVVNVAVIKMTVEGALKMFSNKHFFE